MKWKKDRDLLIAQTLAFVQSVTSEKTDAEDRAESIPLDLLAEVKWPAAPAAPVVRPTSPARLDDMREEIRRRVAAFRAHQELFSRDRDEYFKSVLAKARSAAGRPSGASSDQPVKR
jgi:predicted metal-dependent phosphoesterase TrpH